MVKWFDGTLDLDYCKQQISKACTAYQKGNENGIKSFGRRKKRRVEPTSLQAWMGRRRKNLMERADKRMQDGRKESTQGLDTHELPRL